ncbi:MAG TPA: DUF402 domain-containing protein [Micromonosporaceae bacterium]|nr:DUF402 domain-containing protein [Micromonosporaceae bacterium]
MRFSPGRVVLHRHWHGDRLGLLKTAVVAADDDRGLLLWVPRRAPMLDRKAVDGRGLREMSFGEWLRTPTELKRVAWNGPGVLMLLPPGEPHSIWWLRHEDGSLRWVYVNLEEPAVRWDDGGSAGAAGVDIVDQDLDVVVNPDGSWEWKDDDEFTERLAYPGWYWVRDEEAVRAEGRRMIKKIEAREFPFDGSLLDFSPDPAWSVPAAVPTGWDRPRAY